MRDNLYHFLRSYQTRQDWLVIWMDAICNNQAGVSERRHQVRLMRQIFGNARSVYIWLGYAVASTSQTLMRISQISDPKSFERHADDIEENWDMVRALDWMFKIPY